MQYGQIIRPRQEKNGLFFECQLQEHVALATCSCDMFSALLRSCRKIMTCSQRHAKFACRCTFKYSVLKSTVYLPTLHKLIQNMGLNSGGRSILNISGEDTKIWAGMLLRSAAVDL